MSWHLGRLCGFDLETTGVDVEEDRIVTACVVQWGGKHPTTSTTWLANPGVDIPEGAAAVHGITTEQAQAEGQPAGQVVQQVVQALAQTFNAGIPIVAMNAPFDLTMLDREARRHRVFPLADYEEGRLRVIDPRILDKQVDKYRSGKRTLTDLCAHYGVPLDGAHSADADALAACRVAWRLGSRFPKLAELDLDGLHKAQVEWAAEQAASFQAHRRRKGETDAVIDGSWPLRPAGGAA
jgi:DNA polymerase-3 subunit epsilon